MYYDYKKYCEEVHQDFLAALNDYGYLMPNFITFFDALCFDNCVTGQTCGYYFDDYSEAQRHVEDFQQTKDYGRMCSFFNATPARMKSANANELDSYIRLWVLNTMYDKLEKEWREDQIKYEEDCAAC